MSPREFSEVDHDLLADYVGGALDGTPEQATVARLVAEDPAWGRAYAALAPAVQLVRADLAEWASAPAPEMPAAVADRIAAALAGAGPAPTLADATDLAGVDDLADEPDLTMSALVAGAERGGRAGSGTPGEGGAQETAAAGGGHRRTGGTSRSAEGPGRSTGPGRRRRRWARVAGPVALAAASVAAVGLGVNQLVTTQNGSDAAVTAQSDRNEKAAPTGGFGPLAATPFRTTGPARRSGTDYTPEQLSGATRSEPGPTSGSSAAASTALAPGDERLSEGAGLDRLTGREALDACLGAISSEHAGGTVTVDLIDYASFQGRPALVVTFVDAGGARWAWVSGPECGVPGSGAGTRFRTRVG